MIIRTIMPSITFSKITIFDIGEENFAAANRQNPCQRFHYLLHFVIEGTGVYTTSSPALKTRNDLKESDLFAIYGDDTVAYYSNPQTPMHYLWVGFEGDDCEKIFEYIGFSKQNPVLHIHNKNVVLQAFNEIFDAWNNQDSYLLLCKFFNLISILRANNDSLTKSNFLQHDNLLLQRAETLIRLNIYRNFSVQELADMLHVDRSYFARIFKQYYHVTPHIYISQLRLKNAETLIKTTNLSITQIVNILNFTDTYSFSKQFKKMFGHPPSIYRKLANQNAL